MIARKALLAFSSKLFGQAVGYVGVFFVARYMGPGILGVVSFGFAYVGFLGFLGDLGFGVAHIKKVSEGKDLAACMGTYFAISCGLALIRALAVVATVAFTTRVLHHNFESPGQEVVIYLALLTVSIYTFTNVMTLTFAARQETARQNLGDMLSRIVETAIKIAVAIAGMGVVMLAGTAVVGAVIALCVSLWMLRGISVARPSRAMARDYLLFAMPVTILVSANAVTENLDKVMIQMFWSSAEVGYYTGAGKIAQVIGLTGNAVGMLVFPAISALYGKGDMQGIRRLTLQAERYILMLLLPAGVLIFSYRDLIVRILLGADFAPAAGSLAALAFSTIVFVASVPYSSQIIGTNRPYLSAALSVTLMVLNVLFNLILIPKTLWGIPLAGLGSVGSSIATLAATTIMAAIYRFFSHRATGTRANADVLRVLVAAGCMVATVLGFQHLTGSKGLPGAIAGGTAGAVVYIGLLCALRGITKADLAYLMRMVSPGGMKDYVVGEIRDSAKSDGERK
jgi:O-antigen/teichoic acid export membrane protein